MGVVAVPARMATDALWPGVDGDDPTLMLARMVATMTVPMVAWMRWRGHGRRPTVEMAGAMIALALGVIAVLESGVVEGVAVLMTLAHVVMFAAIFGVMVARPDEYGHGAHEAKVARRASRRRSRLTVERVGHGFRLDR